jgi:BioD-like phosphotransacetylase family protein
VYITSLDRGSGKTTVGAGLGKHLLDNGQKVGFFKPVIADDDNPPIEGADSDTTFMKHLFSLEEPVDLLCPVLSDGSNRTGKIKEAYAKVSQGKDVVIVEGISNRNQASHDIVATLGARVIIVEAYSKELLRVINSCKDFREYLLGLVLNKVPGNLVEQVRGETSTQFSQAGVDILGVLPEDRTLFTLTIGELAERIQGEILSGAEKSSALVEHLMLGAKCIDPGPLYFGVKANKAVVVESERSDMQLAALETSTRCLVLTGDTPPKEVVLHRAEEKDVPIISARDDITAIVTTIETALGKTRFNQENKLARLAEIMERHFDFPAVARGLGPAS